MTPRDPSRADLARITFTVIFIVALLAASLWLTRPFLVAAIWAATVVVATWPLMLRLQRLLWGKRAFAVAVMTLLLLLLFVVPLTMAVVTLVDSADEMVAFARTANDYHLPDKAPQWAVQLPLVGGVIERAWDQATALGLRDLWPRLTPYAGSMTRWFVSQLGNVGFLFVQFLVTVVIAAVLYVLGEDAATLVRRFAARLGGQRGSSVVVLAAAAIRGVALGVVLTAAVQAVITGAGLWLASVPFAGLLTVVVFGLCIAQIGPLPILLPAAGWAFWAGHTGWGIFLLVLSAVVATLDNILRPMFIRMGADLPLLLIFAGVIGGLLAFGLVGLFVGPVVLAVAYTLLEAWIADGDVPLADPPAWRD